MEDIFLLEAKDKDSCYAIIRDSEEAFYADARCRIRALWQSFISIAPEGFSRRLQVEFQQTWWEMYLGVALLNLGLHVSRSPKNEGPDFRLKFPQNDVIVEAVAPNQGDGQNRVPDPVSGQVIDIPQEKFLLRLTSALDYKCRALTESRKTGCVSEDVACIIAVGTCALPYHQQMTGSLSPVLRVLAGAGPPVVTLGGQEPPYFERRDMLAKRADCSIQSRLFETEEFRIVSGVLYSWADPFIPIEKPEQTLELFANPNATVPLPSQLTSLITTYARVSTAEGNESEQWRATPPTSIR